MVCTFCGKVMQSSSNVRSRVKMKGGAKARCIWCGKMFAVSKEDIENEEDIGICKLCGKNPIMEGHKACVACVLKSRVNNEKQKRKEALKQEREARGGKDKESIDDIAVKARAHGVTYGKYLAARYAGYVE